MSKNRKPAKTIAQPKPSGTKLETNLATDTSKTWQFYLGIVLLLVVVLIAFGWIQSSICRLG
jgi:hypothetical protein